MEYLYLGIFLLAPALVKWLCGKVSILGKIGPILLLYALGIVIGNLSLLPFLSESVARPAGLPGIQDMVTSAMVPLAIPLMLFGCRFRRSETRNQALALATGLLAVIFTAIAGYFIFGKAIDSSSLVGAGNGTTAAKIGGMLTGVYTGGTVNLASLQAMLGVGSETYVLLNSYDMVISFLFMMSLIAFGIRLLRRFLSYGDREIAGEWSEGEESKPRRFSALWWKQAGILLGITLLMVGVSAGVASLLPKEWFMTIFILLLTSLGIAASFVRKLREMKIADDLGMYCIYVFSITVASMADFSAMDFSGSLSILGYLCLMIFGSLFIQVLLAKLLKIDADTVVIASTAFICSPPFVPMMAAAMKNRRVVVAGLSIGIIGYAVGTYLGFALSRLLALFS